MELSSSWIAEPHAAYLDWQATEAEGGDRRPFSHRSIVQHTAMFERFLRHLSQRRTTLATFGPEHLESFFEDVDNRCAPGTTTRLRYIQLINRLCRHLVAVGVRQSNPASIFAVTVAWPDDEPEPLFLDPAADTALQAQVQSDPADDARVARNRAVVAIFLGTGITAAELRTTRVSHIVFDEARPYLHVLKHGPRLERIVALPAFCTPALHGWQRHHPASPEALLFPAPRTTDKPTNDVLLGAIVRDALGAIGFTAPDMSPRVLRNTFARRHLLAGRTNEEVSQFLGLASQRTAVRLRATLPVRS